jgi:hypothetical protein
MYNSKSPAKIETENNINVWESSWEVEGEQKRPYGKEEKMMMYG